MKRLAFLAIAVLALAIPAAASAKGKVAVRTLTLTAPTTVVTGDALALSGQLTRHHLRLGGKTVTVSAYEGLKCIGEPVWSEDVQTTKFGQEKGSFSLAGPTDLVAGTYCFKAKAHGANAAIAVVSVTEVVPVVPEVVPEIVPEIPNVFLCYSALQADPGAWTAPEAATLIAQGYWAPFAVLGNVPGGTNLGAYHLVCNLATGQSVPDVHGYLGAGGEVYGLDLHDAYEELLGVYPVAG